MEKLFEEAKVLIERFQEKPNDQNANAMIDVAKKILDVVKTDQGLSDVVETIKKILLSSADEYRKNRNHDNAEMIGKAICRAKEIIRDKIDANMAVDAMFKKLGPLMQKAEESKMVEDIEAAASFIHEILSTPNSDIGGSHLQSLVHAGNCYNAHLQQLRAKSETAVGQ